MIFRTPAEAAPALHRPRKTGMGTACCWSLVSEKLLHENTLHCRFMWHQQWLPCLFRLCWDLLYVNFCHNRYIYCNTHEQSTKFWGQWPSKSLFSIPASSIFPDLPHLWVCGWQPCGACWIFLPWSSYAGSSTSPWTVAFCGLCNRESYITHADYFNKTLIHFWNQPVSL